MGVLKGELKLEDFIAYSRGNYKIKLSKERKEKVLRAENIVKKTLDNKESVYGINSGFGDLCDILIPKEQTPQLQKNLIMSHACGVGKPLSKETVKGAMLLKINALSKGYSGIRLETLETLIDVYNKGIIPRVPKKGSVGGSGDLVPLAHIALVLIGEGEAIYDGELMPGGEALKKAGIEPVRLSAKEGLSLINGTEVMTSTAALCIYDALKLAKTADIAIAMTLEALVGSENSFDQKIHEVKPQPGQEESARNVKRLVEGSEILKQNSPKLQDAYSLRCAPQVHGAFRHALNYAKNIVGIEMNSITDNPLIIGDKIISGGNFHGESVSISMNYVGIALSELGNISERRLERMLNPKLSNLPPFLILESGLNSGLMIAQYTAVSLVSENKKLAYPSGVDSIPLSACHEDHVSMGAGSVKYAKKICKNIEYILGIELMAAAQALEFHAAKKGIGTETAYNVIRKYVKPLEKDRILYKDIEKMYELVHNSVIVKEVEKEIGGLK